VLNLAGVEVPRHMQGRPFLGPALPPEREYVFGARCRIDERYDIIRTARDGRYRYIRNYEPWKPYYQWVSYAERTPTMKDLRRLHAEGRLRPEAERFMASSKPVEELYDTEADPHEVRNLAGDVRLRGVLERLRRAHVEWMLRTRDTGLIPEPLLDERGAELGSRYAVLHRPGGEEYLRRLVELASAAGSPSPGDRRSLLAAVRNDDAVFRYWGATGLGLLGRADRSLAPLVKGLIGDPSPVVRVAAARALCMMDFELEETALPALAKELTGRSSWTQVLAANVIDDLGRRARPIADALRRAAKGSANRYAKRVVEHTLDVLKGSGP
jgi:uncharacterized sulfatase